MCRIKALRFDLLNEGTSPIFAGKSFPTEPLFSDFLSENGNPLMEKELRLSEDGNSDEPLYRACAVVPSSAALDGSQHGIDIGITLKSFT